MIDPPRREGTDRSGERVMAVLDRDRHASLSRGRKRTRSQHLYEARFHDSSIEISAVVERS